MTFKSVIDKVMASSRATRQAVQNGSHFIQRGTRGNPGVVDRAQVGRLFVTDQHPSLLSSRPRSVVIGGERRSYNSGTYRLPAGATGVRAVIVDQGGAGQLANLVEVRVPFTAGGSVAVSAPAHERFMLIIWYTTEDPSDIR